jgi:hypothetical protein
MPPRKAKPRKECSIAKIDIMKTQRLLGLLACALLITVSARAADEARTITGDAMCAKCELSLQDKCQTVIQVKDGDKTTLYYLAGNDVAKAFHKEICKGPAAVTAKGTVETVDGKQVLTASAIDIKK